MIEKKDNHLIHNIYYMLSYAYQALKEDGYSKVATEEFDNVPDLLAAILALGVGQQVKRGLYRDYHEWEEALAGVRGKILVSETIKQQTLRRGRLMCSYDEFDLDTPYNQALKSVMLMLVRHGKVKPENKEALRKLLLYFSDVSEVAPGAIRWDSLRYHRNNASYEMLLGICRLAVEGLLLSTEKGTNKLTRWLQDEQMCYLYQRFVLNYYKTQHKELEAKAPNIHWNAEGVKHPDYLPIMKTDVRLCKDGKQLIIDTKYYGHTMQYDKRFNSRTYSSDHLYQIYAYVMNSAGAAKGDVSGVLLYAMTDEDVTPDEDMTISGHRIGLKTLDLGKDWTEITAQLDELCEWLK